MHAKFLVVWLRVSVCTRSGEGDLWDVCMCLYDFVYKFSNALSITQTNTRNRKGESKKKKNVRCMTELVLLLMVAAVATP